MRFHQKFVRRIGAVSTDPVLGSDSAPTAQANVSDDRTLNARFKDVDGWPCHRIAIGYTYSGAGTPLSLPASLYVWDDLTESWFLISSGVTLRPGRITFIECIGIQPPIPSPGSSGTAGSIEVALDVNKNAAGDPDGIYTFVLAPDQTAPGAGTPSEYHTFPGTNGTESVAAGKQVVGITAFAAVGVANATVKVGTDDACPVPDGGTLTLVPPSDSLRGPVDIVFANTAGYTVETVE